MKIRIGFGSKTLEEREVWLGEKWHGVERSAAILCTSIAAYGIVFSCLTILRYYSFMTRAWDLGIFTQSLWTTLYANRFLFHTCELFVNPSGAFFGVHFSPILLFILPLYRLITAPETLLVLQSFVLGLASVPLYKLAKESAGGRLVGLVFSGVYLMYPATQYVNLYDFHVQAFLPLFFSSAMYYMFKEHWPRYVLFLFLSLMVEEHAAWITFAMGLFLIWRYRSQIISAFRGKESSGRKYAILAVLTMAISATWYWFTIWQRNTFFTTNPMAINEFLGASNFAVLGARDPLEIPLLIITRPWNAIIALAYDGHMKLLYAILLFGPLAFTSLKARSMLIPALPWFAFSFLSSTTAHHALGHQYDAYVVSFIFVASIAALRKNFLKTSTLSSVKDPLKKIVVFSLMFFFIASPLCPLVNIAFPGFIRIRTGDHELQLNEVLKMVPPTASILTQDNIFTQVSHRENAYVVPDRFLESSIRDLATSFVNDTMDIVEYILVDNRTDLTATNLVVSLLEKKPLFRLIASRDENSILLYKRQP